MTVTWCAEMSADPEGLEKIQPLLEGEYTEKKSRTLSPECARVVMVNYPFMDLEASLAECSKNFNEQHNQLKDELFGSMNELLLAQTSGCCAKPKMKQRLRRLPTLKETKVNVFELLCRNEPQQFMKMMDECSNNTNNFIRAIDSSSNLPFLLFVLTPICTQLRLWITVAVIFSDTGIEHKIIADFQTKRDRKIKPHWGSLSIQHLVHFMENGELKNDLGYQPITRWIHLKEKSNCQKAKHVEPSSKLPSFSFIFCLPPSY